MFDALPSTVGVRAPADFESWFRTYRAPLVRWLSAKVGDADTAQDLSQASFLYLYNLAARTTVSHPQALLFKTAGWLAANELRRRRRSARHISSFDDPAEADGFVDAASTETSPEILASLRQEAEMTLDAIRSLPPKTQTAFSLSRIDGLTYDEIAATMRISKSSVEKHMMAALIRLRAAESSMNCA